MLTRVKRILQNYKNNETNTRHTSSRSKEKLTHTPPPKPVVVEKPPYNPQLSETPIPAPHSNERKKTTERATEIVQQENMKKQERPSYPGLEKYDIILKLGDGAFSNVYKAKETDTNKEVAIKVTQKVGLLPSEYDHGYPLHPSIKKKPKVTESTNIQKEVQIMKSLHHPNIVELLEFSESSEHYYMTLELCSGGELFHQIVHFTYFSEDLARHIIEQVASSIWYLHEECGIVHRDIKPENILFDPIPLIPSLHPERKHRSFDDPKKQDEGEFIQGVGGGGIGRVKIADFGLSKVIWDSSTRTPCGTVGYTAPEIVRDKKYSKSVDMWAIGCVLYTMLCGFPPFYDESIRILTEKVARGQYSFLSPWWDPISDSAKDLISHLLCVDPGHRYTIDQFLIHPWMTQKPLLPPKPTRYQDTLPSLSPAKVNDPRILALHNAARKAAVVEREADERQRDLPEQQQSVDCASLSKSLDTPTYQQPSQEMLFISEMDSYDSHPQEVFTPGVTALREILDITHAVQRIGEEKAHQQAAQKYRENDFSRFLDSLSSDSDDEHDQEDMSEDPLLTPKASVMGWIQPMKNDTEPTMNGSLQNTLQDTLEHTMGSNIIPSTNSTLSPGLSSQGTQPRKTKRKDFQLNISNATLLKNRRLPPA
ncbi:kinase-like domain-containing protein [Spinellus fusiger]|nr:kinase-like domain-containing protein [Spinellus fusiger]